jgi:hypothetical protein
MSEAALRARRRNLSKARVRSDRESLTIKLLIRQSCLDAPRPSQRTLASQLGVCPSYVCKVQAQSARGLDALATGKRVTLGDLNEARDFTAKIREQEPGLLASVPQPRPPTGDSASERPRVMTEDEAIAETWRITRGDQRKSLSWGARRVLFRCLSASKEQSSGFNLTADRLTFFQ